MIPFRPRDVFGIVGWYNQYSDDLDQPVDDTSQGFEAYYRIQVTPWLQVSPSMQFLIDPGFEEGNDDTLILGLRTLIHL